MAQEKFHHRRLARVGANVKHWLGHFPRMLSIVRAVRTIMSPEALAIRRLQRHQGEFLLQPFPTTKTNRHPALFAFAKQQLAGKSNLRILSFGCSTGEEPLTLMHYFPDAIIDAIDINPRNIKIARRKAAKQGAYKINFLVGGHPPDAADHYDAIFCLSVLRHGQLDSDQPAKCSDIFPFSKFNAVVAALDLTIRTGGLLFIWGSNFQFSDCAVASRYRPINIPGMRPHGGVFYGPDDKLLERRKVQSFAFEKL